MTDVDRSTGGVRRDPEAGRAPEDVRERRSLLGRLRFLVTPRWIALIIGAISFALACYLVLAPWQFGRNAQRSELNAAISAAIKAPPAPIGTLMSTNAQPAQDAIWHQVSVTGTFDPAREVYIRLRQDADGNPASEVVVPFVTAGGPTVLVDRGYVSFTSVQQGQALPGLPSGTVTITGRVQADQTDPKNRPAVRAPDGRMQYTAASSALAGPGPVFRGYLQLTDTSPGVITAIGLPQQDSGPFFSYALQWLAFGAIAVLGIGYFIYREVTDPPEEDIYVSDGAQASGGDGAAGRDEAVGDDAAVGGPDRGPAAEAPAAAADGPGDARRAVSGRPAPAGAAHAASPAEAPRRRRRGGFDKSQLYDPR